MPKGKKAKDISVEELFLSPRSKTKNPWVRNHLTRAYRICTGENEPGAWHGALSFAIKTAGDLMSLKAVFWRSHTSASLRRRSDGEMVRHNGVGKKTVAVIVKQLAKHGLKFKVIRFIPSKPSIYKKKRH